MITLTELVPLLKQYQPLIELLNITDTESKIYPVGIESSEESIIYSFTPVMSDGVKEQGKFEITCIGQNLIKAMEILELVKDCLLTIGDTKLTSKIHEVILNGGETAVKNEKTGMIQIKSTFVVKNNY